MSNRVLVRLVGGPGHGETHKAYVGEHIRVPILSQARVVVLADEDYGPVPFSVATYHAHKMNFPDSPPQYYGLQDGVSLAQGMDTLWQCAQLGRIKEKRS